MFKRKEISKFREEIFFLNRSNEEGIFDHRDFILSPVSRIIHGISGNYPDCWITMLDGKAL